MTDCILFFIVGQICKYSLGYGKEINIQLLFLEQLWKILDNRNN